jgi:epsilon-lactone hydrolase
MKDWSADILIERLQSLHREEPGDLAAMRSLLDSTASYLSPPADVAVLPTEVAQVAAEWLRPVDAQMDSAIVYLHGGGYVAGSCASHRHLAGALAKEAGVAVLLLDYRRAPEHPHPAAVEDAVAVLGALSSMKLALAGDSAGGGLAIMALQVLRDQGAGLPRCAVLMSPWLDLRLTGPNRAALAAVDPTLSVEALAMCAQLAQSGGASIEPLNGSLAGLPPVLIQAGSREILLDDAQALHRCIEAAGGRSELLVAPGMFHVYQAFVPRLPEARAGVARAAAFLRHHLQADALC